jgi:hypothetical protein
LGAVAAFEEGSLIGEEEAGSGGCGQEFDGGERGRDALGGEGHGVGEDDAAAGEQVQIAGFVGPDESLRRAVCREEAGGFLAADAEVECIVLDVVMLAFGKPAAFLGGVGEGGVDAWGRDRAIVKWMLRCSCGTYCFPRFRPIDSTWNTVENRD